MKTKDGFHTEKLLSKIYYDLDSPASYSGIDAILREAKRHNPSISQKDVKHFLQEQEVYTLHKPIKRKFKRNRVVAAGLDTDWQADLCDMQKLKKENDGYAYILTCIDVLSKYAWAIPVHTKRPTDVLVAFKEILKDGRKPWKLMTDKGTEFLGREFQKYLYENDIQHFTSQNDDIKCSIAENYNRKLKTRLWKHFSRIRNYRWIAVLPKIAAAINKSYHRSIKCRPIDVNDDNYETIWHRLYDDSHQIVCKFKVGDSVRISKYKHIFEKGYLPNFTTEIFTVTQHIPRKPPVYRIADKNNDLVEGVFYEPELVKVVESDDIYRIEEILQRHTRKGIKEVFVKWEGYPKQFNQWIKESDIISTI